MPAHTQLNRGQPLSDRKAAKQVNNEGGLTPPAQSGIGAVKLLFILARRRACRRFTGKRGENIIPHRSTFCQVKIIEKIAQRSFLKFVYFAYCNFSGQGV